LLNDGAGDVRGGGRLGARFDGAPVMIWMRGRMDDVEEYTADSLGWSTTSDVSSVGGERQTEGSGFRGLRRPIPGGAVRCREGK
jgi:hypothetical protein